jgi:hypothetical protein
MGVTSFQVAMDEYDSGNTDIAENLLSHSNTFLDIAVGSTPFVGFFKDCYEAYSGMNMLTGDQLGTEDRIFSVVGVGLGIVTGGTAGGFAKNVIKKMLPFAKKILPKAMDVIESARKSNIVSTPFGKATQEMTKDAIAARAKVQRGDYVYRLGKRGRSQTGKDAQFWSLEHPKTPGYGNKYGIPEENIRNADFIERATIKSDNDFITRKAPAVGNNNGGGMEVVTTRGGVVIESHTTLD